MRTHMNEFFHVLFNTKFGVSLFDAFSLYVKLMDTLGSKHIARRIFHIETMKLFRHFHKSLQFITKKINILQYTSYEGIPALYLLP